MNTIFELAINKVKEGQLAAFKEARSAFITEMKKADGVGPDAAVESFFTMPGENDTEVFVGITEWASIDAFGKAAEGLVPTTAFQNYFKTFEQLAYLQLRPEDTNSFDVSELLKDGYAIEFAVRTAKPGHEGEFDGKRKAFFDKIAEQPGYVFDREFVALEGGENVVFIVWESIGAFQQALGVLAQAPEMGAFMSILDIKAYQATAQAGL